MAKLKKILLGVGLLSTAVLSACNNSSKADNKDITSEPEKSITAPAEEEITQSGVNDITVVEEEIINNDKEQLINEDKSFGVLHPFNIYNDDGIIKNRYVQSSIVVGSNIETTKVNLRYIFEIDTTDRDLSSYNIKIELNLKHSRSDYIVRTIRTDINAVYNGYYSNSELITKDGICFVVYTLTNIPYNSWDYDLDVNCIIESEEESESAEALNNVLSVLVEEENDILESAFSFDEANEECILTEYNGLGTNITIPDRKVVTEIDENSGRNYSYYKEVTGIGEKLLENNTNIETLVIPNGIKTIGRDAFKGCTSLQKVTMPNTVTTISDGAFEGCNSLNEIMLSKNLMSIGGNAFTHMPNIIYYGGKSDEKTEATNAFFSDDNINWYYKTYDETTVDSKGNHWYYRWNDVNQIVAKTYHEVTLNISKDEKELRYIADGEYFDCNSFDCYKLFEDNKYFIGCYYNGQELESKLQITSDVTIDVKWVEANQVQYGEEVGYELYNLQDLNIETIDLTKYNNDFKILSISYKNDEEHYPSYFNDVTKTIKLPETLKKCSDKAFKGFNIQNVYFDGDAIAWAQINFEGLYATPSSSNSFKNFYVLKNDDYERITTLNLENIPMGTIGDYQFLNMTQIDSIILRQEIEYISPTAFGLYEPSDISINVYYHGDSFRKLDIIRSDLYWDNDYNATVFNRLARNSKWYYYNDNIYNIYAPGDYWKYDDNRNIITNSYYEVRINHNNAVDSYIRPKNSTFSLENIPYSALYYDEYFEIKFDSTVLTSNLELYAKDYENISCTFEDAGNYYIVNGIIGNQNDVIIPDAYNNKPVTKIAAEAFKNTDISSITFGKNIISIGADAFLGCTNLNYVNWNNTFVDWCNIEFENGYSNPMSYAENFNILKKFYNENNSFLSYAKIEIPYLYSSNPVVIKNNSLIGFDKLILNVNHVDFYYGCNPFLNTSINDIYYFGYDINSTTQTSSYNDIKNKIENTNIKLYRYINDFNIIRNTDFEFNNNDLSGYWFNISDNNVINKEKYYKVLLPGTGNYVKEGDTIESILPTELEGVTLYYRDSNEVEQEFNINTPINNNYDIYAKGDISIDNIEYRVTLHDYYKDEIHVDSRSINVKKGKLLNLYKENFNEYEIENIYRDSNYNELFDINTPIDSDIELYPKYVKKLNYTLIYDDLMNRYAYTVNLNGCSGNIIIPSTYKGIPVISITSSGDYGYYPSYDSSIYNLIISEGIREIGAEAFKNISINNLVIPKSLKIFGMSAFGYEQSENFKKIENVYYNGKLSDWLKINFENEYSNPIYYSKNLNISNNDYIDFNIDNPYDFGEKYSPLTEISKYTLFGDNFDNYYENNPLVINQYQFINLETLTNIDFNEINAEIIIRKGAFSNCKNLLNISFNEIYYRAVQIKSNAFENCKMIDTLKLGKSMDIDTNAFNYCQFINLIITIDNSYIYRIRNNAFSETIIEKVYYKYNEDYNSNNSKYISNDNESLFNTRWFIYDENPDIPGNYWYYYNNTIVEYECKKIIIKLNYGFNDYVIAFNGNNCNYNNEYSRDTIRQMISEYIGNKYVLDRLYFDSAYTEEFFDYNHPFENQYTIYAKVVPNLNYDNRGDGIYVSGLGQWGHFDYYDENDDYAERSLVIPEYYNGRPVVGIANDAFRNAELGSIILPDSITHIGDNAFKDANVWEIKLSKNIKAIGNNAFEGCRIMEFKLPNVVTIGDNAFANSELMEVTLPKLLESIGVGAFKNCRNLRRVINKSIITEIPEEAFAMDDYGYFGYESTLIEISENVSSIGKNAFKNRDVRLVIYSNNVAFDENAYGDNDYYTHEIYIYPLEFNSNIGVLNSKFRFFNYTTDFEEKRTGNWWYFAPYDYMVFTIINI